MKNRRVWLETIGMRIRQLVITRIRDIFGGLDIAKAVRGDDGVSEGVSKIKRSFIY
jgi:hypothetical protein